MALTVALDFDGVLADYHGWKGEDHVGDPLPGAQDFVGRLINAGYVVVIHSTRDRTVLTRWLLFHGFPPIEIAAQKPPAYIYIDDRGYRFNGNWDAAFKAIRRRAWWEKS